MSLSVIVDNSAEGIIEIGDGSMETISPTLMVVSVLCVVQFVWTLVHERDVLTVWNVGASLLGVVLFLLVFHDLYKRGNRMARRKRGSGNGA